jgi:hypothetical protein
MFSSQVVYCLVCGIQHKTNFNLFQGRVCSWKCWDELRWIETLSMMGEEFRPITEEAKLNKSRYENT